MSKRAKPAPSPRHPPRLPGALGSGEAPALDDESEWHGLDVVGDVAGPPDVSHADITACRVRNVRLTGRTFDHLRVADAVFEDCEMSGVTFAESVFTRVEFHRCRMSGLVASGLKASDLLVSDCRLDGANFRASEWERSQFEDCELPTADFYQSKLAGLALLGCNLTGAEFAKAAMAGTLLHRSVLTDIRGADAFGGAVIGTDQIIPLALPLYAALGIVVDDDRLPPQ